MVAARAWARQVIDIELEIACDASFPRVACRAWLMGWRATLREETVGQLTTHKTAQSWQRSDARCQCRRGITNVAEAWAGRVRGVYDPLIWIAPLVAAARIRASFQRPHEPTIPTSLRVARARAARDVFTAAGIHRGCHDESGVEGRTCDWTDPRNASISWSACVAWRHSSQMSPRRASSEVIVSIAAMGTNGTRHYGVGGSAKGHFGGRFDRG